MIIETLRVLGAGIWYGVKKSPEEGIRRAASATVGVAAEAAIGLTAGVILKCIIPKYKKEK